jgi:hypothetical protein
MSQPWITIREAEGFMEVSRMELYRRMAPDAPDRLVWRDRREVDGKPGRLIYAPSMPDDAIQRWRKAQFLKAADAAPVAAAPALPDNSGQARLFPLSAVDLQLRELQAQCGKEMAAACNQLFQAFRPSLNHEHMVLGERSVTSLLRKQARLIGVSDKTLARARSKYLVRESILDLAPKRPGPAKGAGSVLDAAIRAEIRDCWEEKLYTRAQTTRHVVDWIKKKQSVCGGRYTYEFLTESKARRWMAVERFIESIGGDNNPRRRRKQGLSDQVGYIDRLFDDEFSGDGWAIDEWELDGAFYNPRNRSEIYWGDSGKKPYLISVIDERSTYLLGASLTLNLTADTVLDLLEALVRAYGPPLRLVSDRGGHFRRGVGGRIMVRQRGELVERCMGAMANFGVQHDQPRKKNPRGNRIERTLHGIYADLARRDFGPSWKGANVEERKLTEIDERVARHLKEHCQHGTCGPQILSYDDAERITSAWRDEINMMSGRASGLYGLTRKAAWLQFQRPESELAARMPSEDQIRQAFAEHYKEETIEPGGVVTLPDKSRYEHPLLSEPEFARRTRNVVRYRDDHSFIIVLAAHKGDENLIARCKVSVGRTNREELSRQCERRASLEKLIKSMSPLRAEPVIASPKPPAESGPPMIHPEISSVEFLAGKKHIIRPAEFFAPEVEKIPERNTGEPGLSLYDYSEQGQVEKL